VLSIEYGNEVLARTPDMLPILKEAGVVDSGGKGLLTVLEGSVSGTDRDF
jgi:dihydroxyacetone kinase-like predicted kinase